MITTTELPPSADFFLIQPLSLPGEVWTALLNEPGTFLQRLETLPAAWNGWERLRGEGSLQASGDQMQDDRADWLEALGSARNFPLARCVGLEAGGSSHPEPTDALSTTSGGLVEVVGCQHQLLVNDFCVFLLISRASVRPVVGADGTARLPSYAEASVALRDFLDDDRPGTRMRKIRARAIVEVDRLIGRILPGRVPLGSSVAQRPNTGHLLQLYYEPFAGEPSEIHAAEETASQCADRPAFLEAHPCAHAHFGHSDSSMAGVPATRALACLPFCCFLQGSWYLINFFRSHLIEIMPRFCGNDRRESLGRLAEDFDLFVLSFERFGLSHSRFMGSLRPWQHEAARRLEASWQIPGNLRLVKETLESIRGFVERRYRGAEEASGQNQERALNLIALLQIFTIISVTADYLSLVGSHHAWIHWAALSSTVVILLMVIRIIFRAERPA